MHTTNRQGRTELVDAITGTADKIKGLLKVALILFAILFVLGVCGGIVLGILDGMAASDAQNGTAIVNTFRG